MPEGTVAVRVWGDYACFSRPEFKVERVSYPVMTPSAARGILEAVFWRPEIRYEIRRIGLLKAGTPVSILRNEIDARQGRDPLVVEAHRQQRTSLVLRNVDYLIEADARLRPHAPGPLAKYLAQIERRIERGQCFRRPYLGSREFAADFEPAGGTRPDPVTFPVGTMLFDIAYVESPAQADMTFRRPNRPEPVDGYHHPLFMTEARVENGWLSVPPQLYEDLYRLEAADV